MSQINFERLWKIVVSNPNRVHSDIHGPDHWRRVERNGLYICQSNGADEDVVRLFALFHDSMRLGDGRDPEHGLRGANYAKSLLNQEYQLTAAQFELLDYACKHHTKQRATQEKTIGTCWDADRLDLRRVGVRPSVDFMHSSEAKRIIKEENWKVLGRITR